MGNYNIVLEIAVSVFLFEVFTKGRLLESCIVHAIVVAGWATVFRGLNEIKYILINFKPRV